MCVCEKIYGLSDHVLVCVHVYSVSMTTVNVCVCLCIYVCTSVLSSELSNIKKETHYLKTEETNWNQWSDHSSTYN